MAHGECSLRSDRRPSGPVCVRTKMRQPALHEQERPEVVGGKMLFTVWPGRAAPIPGHQARAGGHAALDCRPGISPGSGGPNAGRPSTSMSCATSSAESPLTSWAGWRRSGRTPKGIEPEAFGPRRADDQQVYRPTVEAPALLSRPQECDDQPAPKRSWQDRWKYRPGFRPVPLPVRLMPGLAMLTPA